MKYYYNKNIGYTDYCPYIKSIKIGSWTCTTRCINIIEYNDDKHYIECKYLNLLDRTKKLNSL